MLKLRYISAKSHAGDPWTQREPRLWGRSTSNHSEPRVWTKRSCQVKGLKNLAAKHEEHQHRTVGGETNKNREWSIDYGPNRRFRQQKMVICPTNMRKYCTESNFIYIYIYIYIYICVYIYIYICVYGLDPTMRVEREFGRIRR